MLNHTTTQLCQTLSPLRNDSERSALLSVHLMQRFSIDPAGTDLIWHVGTIDTCSNAAAVRNWAFGQLESPYYVNTVDSLELLITRFEKRMLNGDVA